VVIGDELHGLLRHYTTRRLPDLRTARVFIANYLSVLKFPLL
jgi:hypothetical protein